jgi:hypothetical protein
LAAQAQVTAWVRPPHPPFSWAASPVAGRAFPFPGWANQHGSAAGPPARLGQNGQQRQFFFPANFFLFSGIRKTVQKIQNYIFSVIENFRDIYGLFFIPLRTLVLLFIFYAIFPVNYETNVD